MLIHKEYFVYKKVPLVLKITEFIFLGFLVEQSEYSGIKF